MQVPERAACAPERVAADACEASPLVPGRRLRLRGLQSRPELNGHEAEIRQWLSASQRFAVEVVAGNDALLAVRPGNLTCDCVDFRLRLDENEELLTAAILPHLDVESLCRLRSADSMLLPLVRSELRSRPGAAFQHDWRRAPESRRAALFERAWAEGGFAADTPRDWFCQSSAPRAERPAELRLRVGDLFQHASTGYLGYVIGWDSRTRAPREWVESHRSIQAPGTRCDRLFAPHLSVREFIPDLRAPQGVGFQTRYVIEDALRRFDPDGLGRAEAQRLQDSFGPRTQLAWPGTLAWAPPTFLWRVLSALHNDALMLKICVRIGKTDGLGVLGAGTDGDEPGLSISFGALEGSIVPRTEGVAPRGEDDLVFKGSGRLVPTAALRERYPRDAGACRGANDGR